MKFETWEKYILQVFAVGFDTKENPLLTSPQSEIKKSVEPNTTFFPVEVKGEWLKVKWDKSTETRKENNKQDTGWLRWKKDGKLFIELFNMN